MTSRSHGMASARGAAWPLPVILMVQSILSIWTIMASTGPSNDEALYLRIGHLELSGWLHASAAPVVAPFFSGAPVVYPPVGAIADGMAGLTGARILSMLFMLGATGLLWATTSMVLSRTAATCSAALFAVLAPVIHVGSLATYDAMALFLVAAATWCVVHRGWLWLAAGCALLVVADVTKYASTLFDPVVCAVAVLAAWKFGSGRTGIWRGVVLAAATAAALAGLIMLAGPSYLRGVKATTLTRRQGLDPAPVVILHALGWGWTILLLAVVGVLVSAATHRPLPDTALLAALAAAGYLAPAEQARIHTLLSLDKHLAFGAWFGAIPAGYAVWYALERLRTRSPLRAGRFADLGRVAVRAGILLLIPLSVYNWNEARQMAGYSRTDYLIPVLRPLTAKGGRFLSDTARVDAYGLPGVPWQDWIKVQSTEAQTRTQQLAHQIMRNSFTLIVLGADARGTPQGQLRAIVSQNAAYKIVSRVPSSGPRQHDFLVWQLKKGRTQ